MRGTLRRFGYFFGSGTRFLAHERVSVDGKRISVRSGAGKSSAEYTLRGERLYLGTALGIAGRANLPSCRQQAGGRPLSFQKFWLMTQNATRQSRGLAGAAVERNVAADRQEEMMTPNQSVSPSATGDLPFQPSGKIRILEPAGRAEVSGIQATCRQHSLRVGGAKQLKLRRKATFR